VFGLQETVAVLPDAAALGVLPRGSDPEVEPPLLPDATVAEK
jgi:hypothetical protein